MPRRALLTLDVHLTTADRVAALRRDVVDGLTGTPKVLPPKWFYDTRGSLLFDAITRLPEYYPTRREREILGEHAADVAARSGADTIVELGSGTSEKTRLLLAAFTSAGQLRRFVPFDVDESTLRMAGEAVAAEYPTVEVHAVVGDFERQLAVIPRGGRRMVAFLGSTIGNLEPAPRAGFLAALRATLQPGDSLLLGTDLVKDPARLVAAYDDAEGITVAFNRNVLTVINRELGGTFEPEQFDHVARWDPEQEWIEMRLRSRRAQRVDLVTLGLSVPFASGEEIRTEVSAKFRRPGVSAELDANGFELGEWWEDGRGDFALSLSFAR